MITLFLGLGAIRTKVLHHELVKLVHEDVAQEGTHYTSNKVAKLPIEFSTSIPRNQLRPGYGDGFLGAPLQAIPPEKSPTPREQGDRRGRSRTKTAADSEGSRHV